jgi:hypothetical protein
MKLWLKQGGAIDPHDEELYQTIWSGLRPCRALDGKIQLESKEDMKERPAVAEQGRCAGADVR